jgi:hypothetical protein
MSAVAFCLRKPGMYKRKPGEVGILVLVGKRCQRYPALVKLNDELPTWCLSFKTVCNPDDVSPPSPSSLGPSLRTPTQPRNPIRRHHRSRLNDMKNGIVGPRIST